MTSLPILEDGHFPIAISVWTVLLSWSFLSGVVALRVSPSPSSTLMTKSISQKSGCDRKPNKSFITVVCPDILISLVKWLGVKVTLLRSQYSGSWGTWTEMVSFHSHRAMGNWIEEKRKVFLPNPDTQSYEFKSVCYYHIFFFFNALPKSKWSDEVV